MLRFLHRALLIFLVIEITFVTVPPLLGQSGAISEYQVKASFLYNFAKFVEWPPSTFPDANTPIAVCILGDDPFGTTLDDLIRGKAIDSRTLVIRRIHRPEESKGCQILFVSTSEDKHLSEILASLKDSSVLTIGDNDEFADRGGAIQFLLEDAKVHFSINVDAIQRAHLTVSAKLLALAKIVHDGARPKGG